MSVLEDLAKLKAEAQRAQTLRAAAVANREHALRALEEIDGRLRALGIDPEQAEQQLADLESRLSVEVAALRTAVAAETSAYESIVAQTKEVRW